MQAVVTDYSDALLIQRSQVEKLNDEIRTAGKEKIGVLTKIKDFNKQINYMHWEHEYMETYIANLEEHYTDLHMLRVTKDLQVPFSLEFWTDFMLFYFIALC